MGFLIDIILIAIILLSVFLGYKKGLVRLGAKLFAGIIAIIVTITVYKPVSGIIINNTQIDEKIKTIIIENMTNTNENEDNGIISNTTSKIENNIISAEAENIANVIVYVVTAIVLFIAVKIILGILISLLNLVAKLPILKQFNEIGGIVYGLLRGVLIVCICVLLMGVFTRIKPESNLKNNIEDTYITKIIYNNLVKF